MNPFFSADAGESRVPSRCYARLDQIEPLEIDGEPKVVFALGAVDANWEGFERGAQFDLNGDSRTLIQRQRAFWSSAFGRPPSERGGFESPFEHTPLFRLEVTVRRDSDLFEILTRAGNNWLEFKLQAHAQHSSHEPNVAVYSGVFTAPTLAHLVRLSRMSKSKVLNSTFDMTTWPNAKTSAIRDAMQPKCDIEYLAVYDVGQGSANALLCSHGMPQMWFDLGGGAYRNHPTRPTPPVKFCNCEDAPVILSHWDTDHWIGGRIDSSMLARDWIAPRQSIDPIQAAFAADILSAGGMLHIIANPSSRASGPFQVTSSNGQTVTLRRAVGSLRDRNASGLVLLAENPHFERGWLLTGDAAYRHIQPAPTVLLSAIVVPHHGADMKAVDAPFVPPRPPSGDYARLAYSFGPDNAHGRPKANGTFTHHPTQAAVAQHTSKFWDHGTWAIGAPGSCAPGGDVLATAQTPKVHLGDALIGWASQPALPLASYCGNRCGSNTCFVQA